MLNEAQERYLNTISESAIAYIKPFDPNAARVARFLLSELKNVVPELEVFWSGALALGISGKNDIDFSVVSRVEDYEKFLPRLIKVLGEPQKRGKENIRWEITKDGFSVDVHLTDGRSKALAEHRKVFELLKNDPSLLAEYEALKAACDGLLLREYQRRKYEFYNRIINVT
ncbi:hypothetical protein D4R52_00500 [bacterium]|nr:MAG: hypothetical protein D4R52_00500 [bacterium]